LQLATIGQLDLKGQDVCLGIFPKVSFDMSVFGKTVAERGETIPKGWH
jgi:hypothetical protein